MDKHALVSTVRDLVAEGKGILAADESSGTIKRRRDSINVPSTEENRRAYREILFTTPGVEAFISGIILYDETMRPACRPMRMPSCASPPCRRKPGWCPSLQPAVLMDGDHTIERCEEGTEATVQEVFAQLHAHRVLLEGMLLKPNMVLSGKSCPQQASVDEVTEVTVRCFRRVILAAVPGIVFLSGGQSAKQATEHLNVMNAMGEAPVDLELFVWACPCRGQSSNPGATTLPMAPTAQQFFFQWAKYNSAARYGKYTREMEESMAYAERPLRVGARRLPLEG